uniref:Receptor ligand binding region domain-containing protein n=1 Tax=Romanomermis culicivorax TaxID=13658 RepID=A0A915KYB7_ROMCU
MELKTIAITGLLAANIDVPTFGYLSVSSELENKQKYTTLIRTANSLSYMSQAIREVLLNYNWNRVVLIRSSTAACDIWTGGFANAFASTSINILTVLMVNFSDPNSINTILNQMKMIARISIVCPPLLPDSALPLLATAYKMGMTYPDYIYILPEYIALSMLAWEPWLQPSVAAEDSKFYQKVYKPVLTIKVAGLDTKNFQIFSDKVAGTVMNESITYQNANYTTDANLVLAAFYDSVYLYGITLNKTVSQGSNCYSGANIMNASRWTVYNGATGEITMDNNGEKVPRYKLGQLQAENSSITYFMLLGRSVNSTKNFNMQILNLLSQPIWGTSNSQPIPDVPVCGFNNEFCKPKNYLAYYIVAGVGIVLAIIVGIVAFYYYKKHKYEAALFESSFKVDMQYFHPFSSKDKSARSRVASLNADSVSTNTHNFLGDGSFETSAHGNNAKAVGTYKGAICIVKRRKKLGRIAFNKADKKIYVVLRSIKEISHDNLNQFIGLSIDENEYFYALWSYCPRGSLEDIIFNPEIRIDETFQVSLTRDIVSQHCLHIQGEQKKGDQY